MSRLVLLCLIIVSMTAVELSKIKPNIPARGRKKPVLKQMGSCGECGRPNMPTNISELLPPLVLGGQPVEPINKYPWVVAVKLVGTIGKVGELSTCGGTILNEYYILTAASCIPGSGPDMPMDIGMMIHFLDNTTGEIDKLIPHPKYKFWDRSGNLKENDVGLIKLKEAIKCDAYKRPVCLPSSGKKLSGGSAVRITGWGQEDADQPNSNETKEERVLKEFTITLLNSKTCSKVPQYNPRKMYCLYDSGSQGACRIGAGGSMVHPVTKKVRGKVEPEFKFFAYGVLPSKAYTTCNTRLPTLYFSLSPHLKWIFKVTGLKSTPRSGQRKTSF